MGFKLKIARLLLSVALAFGVMGFTVFAAMNQTATTNNVIKFTSVHVLATVTGVVSGAKTGTYNNYSSVTTSPNQDSTELGAWLIGSDMEFADETQEIVITIIIVNNSLERKLSFELSNQHYTAWNGYNLDNSNISRFAKYSINNQTPITNATYVSGEIQVEQTKTAVITITLSVYDVLTNVPNFNNSFTLSLRNIGQSSGGGQEPQYLEFNPQSQTLTIPQGTTVTQEDLPEMVVEGMPAYYGLYEDEDMTIPVFLPYSGGAPQLYARFAPEPENLVFLEINNGEELAVKRDSLTDPVLEVPQTLNGIPVTTVPAWEFNWSGVTDIILPPTIYNVGNNAFSNTPWFANQPNGVVYAGNVVYTYKGTMPANTTLTLRETTTGISDSAFQNQTNLIDINFPEGLKRIGLSAFANTRITQIELPSTLEFIDNNAFQSVPLQSIVFANNSKITSIRYGQFSGFSQLTVLDFGTNSSITTIEGAAFSNTQIQSVTIPANVTSIGNAAFNNVPLTTLRFENNSKLTALPQGVFSPANLTTVDFGINSAITDIGYNAFKEARNLTSITLPQSLISLAQGAFQNTGLTSIFIPNTVTSLGYQSFWGTPLQSIIFEDNSQLLEVPSNVFQSNNLNYLHFGHNAAITTIGASAFTGATQLTTLVLPPNLVSIGQNAFQNNGFTVIEMPASVTTITANAFSNVPLQYITFQNNSQLVNLVENAFPKNHLKEIRFGNNSLITAIAGNMFSNATNLTLVDFGANPAITSIGQSAFSGCSSLTNFTFPENLTTIGGSAFANSGLIEAVIPSTLTTLDWAAFPSSISILTINSSYFATTIDGNWSHGNLLNNISSGQTMYIHESITTISTFLTNNFNMVTTDRTGYRKYTRK